MWPGWQLRSRVVTKDSCWGAEEGSGEPSLACGVPGTGCRRGQEALNQNPDPGLQCQHSQVAVRGDARLCLWGQGLQGRGAGGGRVGPWRTLLDSLAHPSGSGRGG